MYNPMRPDFSLTHGLQEKFLKNVRNPENLFPPVGGFGKNDLRLKKALTTLTL